MSNSINSINLQALRNAEFIQFENNFASIILQKNPVTLQVKTQYDTFVLKISELEGLFQSPLANAVTPEIEQLDFRRDEAVTGIIASINANSHHYLPDTREAATLLQNNLKLYNSGIAKENYQAETAIINNLVNDWENKPELTQAMTKLNLTDWANELKVANSLFNQKYMDRTQSYASAPIDTLRSKRGEVMTAFYELRKCLEVFAIINNSALYDSVISEANELIKQYLPLTKSKKKPTADPV